MILQPLPHFWAMMETRDTNRSQGRFISDAREHEELGRVECTQRNNHLLFRRAGLLQPCLLRAPSPLGTIFDSNGLQVPLFIRRCKKQTSGTGLCYHVHVLRLPLQDRVKVSLCGGPPDAIFLGDLEPSASRLVLIPIVEIRFSTHSKRSTGVQKHRLKRVPVSAVIHYVFSFRRVELRPVLLFVLQPDVAFTLLEIREQISRPPSPRPPIVVPLASSVVQHRVRT
mmetsp:Transcript_12553/g.24412  ORF Transcript_12553/g.24412 Transcript_12553/m.24412 type:complete len:226 (+) Transcript_12553:889-1566(+)